MHHKGYKQMQERQWVSAIYQFPCESIYLIVSGLRSDLLTYAQGMLPGVELARRRRIHSHRSDPYLRERLPQSSNSTTNTSMDVTALMARKRLEEKLGCFRTRFNTAPQPPPVRRPFQVRRLKQIQTSETKTTETEVCSNPQLSQRNSEGEVCAVCLDDLQGLREITYLPCAHGYHSDCLLPWLATHSHCPYCRSLVPPL